MESHPLPSRLRAREPRHLLRCHPVLLVFANQLHGNVRVLRKVTLISVRFDILKVHPCSCTWVFPRVLSPFLRSKASVETNAARGIGGVRLVLMVHLVSHPHVGRRRSGHVTVSASRWGGVWGESKVRSLGKETAGETRARHADPAHGTPAPHCPHSRLGPPGGGGPGGERRELSLRTFQSYVRAF